MHVSFAQVGHEFGRVGFARLSQREDIPRGSLGFLKLRFLIARNVSEGNLCVFVVPRSRFGLGESDQKTRTRNFETGALGKDECAASG